MFIFIQRKSPIRDIDYIYTKYVQWLNIGTVLDAIFYSYLINTINVVSIICILN